MPKVTTEAIETLVEEEALGESISLVPRDDVKELRLLFELSQLLDGAVHIEDSLEGALKLLVRHLGMVRGTITLLSPEGEEMHIETAFGLDPIEKARGQYKPGEGVTGRVISTGKPMVVSNISAEPLFLNRTRSRNLQKEQVSFLCVPIKLDDQVVGALSVDRLLASSETLAEDARLLSIVASMLARAAKVRQIYMHTPDSGSEHKVARPHAFVGNSVAMQHLYKQIRQVAPSNTTVLICGESGTGKELTAQAIHAASTRAAQPYVALNCAALPEGLIESELFGHEKGSFTNAVAQRRGRFEMAHGGTLFLDEVGELSLAIQAKLLRVLQERSFERIGGTETVLVDIRIVAATNRCLETMVAEGSFRQDLYYRLNVFPLTMVPLRERKEDIVILASHFMVKYAAANGRTNIKLSLVAADMLQRYDWPGNARELENVMERATLLVGEDGFIFPQHLPVNLHTSDCPLAHPISEAQGKALQKDLTLPERLSELECAYIVEALEASGGHLGKAAQSLGLTERIMALRLKKYGLAYKDFRK